MYIKTNLKGYEKKYLEKLANRLYDTGNFCDIQKANKIFSFLYGNKNILVLAD